jgi:flagellar hook protein FlgE
MSSLTGAFANGVSGLNAYSNAMSAISNNIANARTVGHKREETDFSTLIGGRPLNGEATGGVRGKSKHLVDVQGQIEATQRPYDLALEGRGLFVFGADPVAGGGTVAYSRDGALDPRLPSTTSTQSFLANSEGMYLLAWPTDINGDPLGNGAGQLVPIPASNIADIPGQPTSLASLSAILPATDVTAQTQIQYHDATGAPQVANLTWAKLAINTWQLTANLPAVPATSTTTMTFDGAGALTSAGTINLGGAFTLDVSRMTQFATPFTVSDYVKDGFASSPFDTYEIDDAGIVSGRFRSGVTRPFYRIPVATFANPNALIESSDNMYSASDRSGAVVLGTVDDASARLTSGAVELSNGDLADSFTTMIVTQRAYDSAATVVRTVDEMTQTIRDLKR